MASFTKTYSNTPVYLFHTTTGGRAIGKVNLDTSYASTTTGTDGEVFRALCDPQTTNYFTGPPTPLATYVWSTATDDVSKAFSTMQNLLHSIPVANVTTLSAADRPFRGMAMGQFATTDSQYPTTGGGIADTFFRYSASGSTVPLFVPTSQSATGKHPFLQYEMLNKIFNNTTSRSNVFAVWLTVGFFDMSTGVLGAEIGKSENKNIRHRMFAIVDRSALAIPRQVGTISTAVASGSQTVAMTNTAGFGGAAGTAGITVGTQLLINPGASDYESVPVTAVGPVAGVPTGQITATFGLSHATGAAVYIAPGNWGPQPNFDVTQPINSATVPYYSIIQ